MKVTTIRDAGYKAIETAVKTHIQNVRCAGRDTISIIYYSGHGASDPDTRINYLIPVDVDSADDASLWTNSIELSELVNKLRTHSPEAIHYLMFDACREELHLTRAGKKGHGLGERFRADEQHCRCDDRVCDGPGKTASDMGENGSAYAKALSEEIVNNGAPITLVSATLEHADLKVTSVYAHARPGESSGRYPKTNYGGIRPEQPSWVVRLGPGPFCTLQHRHYGRPGQATVNIDLKADERRPTLCANSCPEQVQQGPGQSIDVADRCPLHDTIFGSAGFH